jgi:hypothetical protein
LKNRYLSEEIPFFSIDTKKKELLGTLYRAGRVYCQKAFSAFDHDFPSWSTGKIVPHGIWDAIDAEDGDPIRPQYNRSRHEKSL